MFTKGKKGDYVNKQELDVLMAIANGARANQRELAEQCRMSLGSVNKTIKQLQEKGYIAADLKMLDKGRQIICDGTQKKNAIILAAGYGMRMVPINMETPKGLLEIHGEPMIERQIRYLQEIGIAEIYVVVGFMKERYAYLMDRFGVRLIVNTEFSNKNNLHSLALASKHIENTYIVPCDVWCESNPFHRYELYSWYMVGEQPHEDSWVRVNRKNELVQVDDEISGNEMIGIAYVEGKIAQILAGRLQELDKNKKYNKSFWETALFDNKKMLPWAKVVSDREAVEITAYEQLREIDSSSNQLKSDAIEVIKECLAVHAEEIKQITVLKKGMTNRSFRFFCKGETYIMRIPGEGMEQLIDRKQEYDVYQRIKDQHICDDLMYINPDNGYKITKYLENARVCDPEDISDVIKCMDKLRHVHNLNLQVDHVFDVFEKINFYESLWDGKTSDFRDYLTTKENVFRLKQYIDQCDKHWVLTHIDAVPDNFLFIDTTDGQEIRLIDWEYAGMQDACLDVAMFAIYSMYDREQVEQLIDAYYVEGCTKAERLKTYCYIAAAGLLWSNWCEYKRQKGVEFGEYSLRQYQYAKEYYKLFMEEKEHA